VLQRVAVLVAGHAGLFSEVRTYLEGWPEHVIFFAVCCSVSVSYSLLQSFAVCCSVYGLFHDV